MRCLSRPQRSLSVLPLASGSLGPLLTRVESELPPRPCTVGRVAASPSWVCDTAPLPTRPAFPVIYCGVPTKGQGGPSVLWKGSGTRHWPQWHTSCPAEDSAPFRVQRPHCQLPSSAHDAQPCGRTAPPPAVCRGERFPSKPLPPRFGALTSGMRPRLPGRVHCLPGGGGVALLRAVQPAGPCSCSLAGTRPRLSLLPGVGRALCRQERWSGITGQRAPDLFTVT